MSQNRKLSELTALGTLTGNSDTGDLLYVVTSAGSRRVHVGGVQPLDADLTALANLSTQGAGRSTLELADPNADRLVFWDDSAGAMKFASLSGLAVSDTTLGFDINSLTQDSTPDPRNDFVVQYDASATDHKKVSAPRRKLTANTTFFVRADGSDSNDGSADTAGSAFLTMTGAATYLGQNVDAQGYTITLSFAAGTYSATQGLTGHLVGQAGASSLVITGGSSAILTSNSSSPTVNILHSGTRVRITGGITISNSGTGSGLRVADNAYVELGNITWGAVGGAHIEVGMGGTAYMFANYSITGNADAHIRVQGNGVLEMYDLTVTLTGTPAFSDGFVYVFDGGTVQTGNMTYSGSATGKRYVVETDGSIINTFGTSPDSYFPGNANGTTGHFGYKASWGGTVTQETSKSTGVTINKLCGTITTHNANLNANTSVTFTVTCDKIAATDCIYINHASGGTAGAYGTFVSSVASGSFGVTILNISASNLAEALVYNYAVIKAVSS